MRFGLPGGFLELETPDWPPIPGVSACLTNRKPGWGWGAWTGFDLGTNSGNPNPEHVLENRLRLEEEISRSSFSAVGRVQPLWLHQIHSPLVLEATAPFETPPAADGAVTCAPFLAPAVLTADCLPILGARRDGSRVGAVHGGWRGLASGILTQAVSQLGGPPSDLQFWIGPGIGRDHYEVSEEVRDAFVRDHPVTLSAFTYQEGSSTPKRYLLDLAQSARFILQSLGVKHIFNDPRSTWTHSHLFYSYRKENPCGRQAALIWRNSP